jgi:hypothetical protein
MCAALPLGTCPRASATHRAPDPPPPLTRPPLESQVLKSLAQASDCLGFISKTHETDDKGLDEPVNFITLIMERCDRAA